MTRWIPVVIGERLITPGAIVQLVFKVRLASPTAAKSATSDSSEDSEKVDKVNEEKDEAFLTSRKEAEDLEPGQAGSGLAHAPFWPEVDFMSRTPVLIFIF